MDEAAARRGVQVASNVSLVVAAIGATVALLMNGDAAWLTWSGVALLEAAGLVAYLCIRHGRRHDHERGRAVATLVVVAALLGLVLVGWWAVVHYRGDV